MLQAQQRDPNLVPLEDSGNRLAARVDFSTVISALAIAVVAFVFVLVMAAQIPAGGGFRLSRPAFGASADKLGLKVQTIKIDTRNVVISGDRSGLYRADKVWIDGCGGIYFRADTSQDGIGPDLLSFGFAKKPDEIGSPFDRADDKVRRLVGDWYVYQAWDDYF